MLLWSRPPLEIHLPSMAPHTLFFHQCQILYLNCAVFGSLILLLKAPLNQSGIHQYDIPSPNIAQNVKYNYLPLPCPPQYHCRRQTHWTDFHPPYNGNNSLVPFFAKKNHVDMYGYIPHP